jgi:hypothetical protein
MVGSRRKKGIYRWGKYGRWKQPTGQFGRKSGGAGLWAGRSGGKSGGTERFAGCSAAHRADPVLGRKGSQNTSSAGPPERSGPPPDQGPKWTAQKPNNFCKETPNEMKPILLES